LTDLIENEDIDDELKGYCYNNLGVACWWGRYANYKDHKEWYEDDKK